MPSAKRARPDERVYATPIYLVGFAGVSNFPKRRKYRPLFYPIMRSVMALWSYLSCTYTFARIRPGDEAYVLEEKSYAKAKNFRAQLESLRSKSGENWQEEVANYNVILFKFYIPEI